MQKILLSIFALLLNACSHSPAKSSPDWGAYINKSTNTDIADKSRWSVEGGSISFNGSIVDGDCTIVQNILRDGLSQLVVNSQGGSVNEAMCIAKTVKQSGVHTTTVRGVCWSSCANYLFLGAEKSVIELGTVGFHGNATALISQGPIFKVYRTLMAGKKLNPTQIEMVNNFLNIKNPHPKLASDDSEKFISAIEKTVAIAKLEAIFLKENHLQQEFFDMTQRPDKGAYDGKAYLFLIPSSETFKQFSIDVVGNNSAEFVDLFNSRQQEKLLYR